MEFRVVDENGEVDSDFFALSHEGTLWRFMSRLSSDPRWYHIVQEKNANIQHCTGKKDVNGIEIWEGDMVRWGKYLGTVIWNIMDGFNIEEDGELEKRSVMDGFYSIDGAEFKWNELEVVKE